MLYGQQSVQCVSVVRASETSVTWPPVPMLLLTLWVALSWSLSFSGPPRLVSDSPAWVGGLCQAAGKQLLDCLAFVCPRRGRVRRVVGWAAVRVTLGLICVQKPWGAMGKEPAN